MFTANASGDSGSVREEFLTLMCSDTELLSHAFDAIITEQYGDQYPTGTKGDPPQKCIEPTRDRLPRLQH
jgi:hypothetical protein